jgi:hypothetical protein
VENLSQGKQDHWQKWISSIGEKHEDDGFDGEFYRRMFSDQITQEQYKKYLNKELK